MLAIKKALNRLHTSLGALEGNLDVFEVSLAGRQRDMFETLPNAANGSEDLDKNVVVARIDRAISKVESVLQEAG